MLELTMDGGKLWAVTPAHPFLLLRGSEKVWALAKEIVAGDLLVQYDPASKTELLARVLAISETA
jgi:intein/homing endonuclease